MISLVVVEGWRVHVSEDRADELFRLGWATVIGLGEIMLTEEGARELLALTDAGALDLVRRRIEGTL